VIHVIAEHLIDLSGELLRVSELDRPFRWPAGRGPDFLKACVAAEIGCLIGALVFCRAK
jgi:hypothetical protein